MRKYKIIIIDLLILFFLLAYVLVGKISHSQNIYNLTKIDSTFIKNEYDSVYSKNPEKLSLIYNKINRSIVNDSLKKATNNQIYSDYLFRNAKYDSAYYFLNKAEYYLKKTPEKLFLNTIKKVNFSFSTQLIENAKFELEKAKKLTINTNSQKNYLIIKSIQLANAENDKKTYDSLAKIAFEEKLLINRQDYVLANEYDKLYFNYLLKKKKYQKLESETSKTITQLLNEKKYNDLLFSNLFYIISSKTYSKSDSINYYMNIYSNLKGHALTNETGILLTFLKANYYEVNHNKNKAILYYKDVLNNSKASNNEMYQNTILKKLMTIDTLNNKTYIKTYIKNNKVLTEVFRNLEDNILRYNSNTEKISTENHRLKEIMKILIVIAILLLCSFIFLFFTKKQKQKNKILETKTKYQNKSIVLYKYLIDIKQQIDVITINKNTDFFSFLNNEIISNLEYLVKEIEKETNFTDEKLEFYTQQIIHIEKNVRHISHQIHENHYHENDLKLLFTHILKKNNLTEQVVLYVSEKVKYSNKKFKKILTTVLFIDNFLKDFIINDSSLKCFISCYRKNKMITIRIWVDSIIDLDENILSHLNEKGIPYHILIEEGTTIEIKI